MALNKSEKQSNLPSLNLIEDICRPKNRVKLNPVPEITSKIPNSENLLLKNARHIAIEDLRVY